LSTDEATKLVDKLNINVLLQDKPTHAISEIFSGVRNSKHVKQKNGFGFCK
jgi:hypothetical protein